MHEYSIVSSLLNLCEKEAKKNNATSVKKVTLQIGKLSAIDPHFMESSFDFFKEDTICKNATLVMKIIDIEIYCNACKSKNIILGKNFYCPDCKSGETKILKGQEMVIESIEIVEEI
ncbi:MAG: hydrogenase nickel incorporation protein HypA/HybF [Sulfurimonas sp.]|jgi:hydrogenase nickel incorporation protein HypA/HybF